MLEIRITQLILKNFRNHRVIKINADVKDNIIALIDDNGTGKTNILEAISLFSSGSSMRGADLQEMISVGNEDGFLVSCIVQTGQDVSQKIDIVYQGGKKKVFINDKTSHQKDDLKNILGMVWITPEMQLEISQTSSARRKFFDKVTCNFHHNHAQSLHDYEKLIKERMKILESGQAISRNSWLDSIEKQIAKISIIINKNRNNCMTEIVNNITLMNLGIGVEIECNVDQMVREHSCLADTFIAAKLLENRASDQKQMRTGFGCHRYDLLLNYNIKNANLSICSSGEKKYVITSLLLAIAQAIASSTGHVPIILIDELTSFVDSKLRAMLIKKLLALKCQIWFTGTEIPDLDCAVKSYKISDLYI